MSSRERRRLLNAAEEHFRTGNSALAKMTLESLIALDPSSSRAHELLGYVHGNEGRLEEARACLERACRLPGSTAQAHYYLGVALLRQGQAELAIKAFDRAMAVAGPFFEALHDRGTAWSSLGRNQLALESYLKASIHRPRSFELLFNLGKVYDALKDFDQALAHYDRALALNPAAADIWAHKGAVNYDQGRHEEAIRCWERALELDPGIEHLPGFLLHARLRLCDWRRWKDDRAELLARLDRGDDVCGPFELLAICGDERIQAGAAGRWFKPSAKALPLAGRPRRRTQDRIRVGYFSADFGHHAVSYLIAELCELHDRSRFETFAFALNRAKPEDDMRARLGKAFDHFHEVAGLPDSQVVALAASLRLDIAVDLGGHTRDSRTGIFHARVAPVQVNFLGYPGSMALPFIDYLVADETVVPAASREHCSERVVWLPDCFQPSDRQRGIAPLERPRSAWGLPDTGFVFCCFNNTYKINPEVFGSWMRILGTVEGSCLWLLAEPGPAQDNLRREAAQAGIDANRLVFGGRLPMAEYLARYRQADLFLDTLPFNGGTTANDALFSGLPILTQAGECFAGRMAASLLKALNLPELIAPSVDEYEAMAVRLANDPARLLDMRSRLRQGAEQGPLFDTARYARHLEAAFEEMVRRFDAGQPPDHLVIPPLVQAPGERPQGAAD